jgi:hypothetical protein
LVGFMRIGEEPFDRDSLGVLLAGLVQPDRQPYTWDCCDFVLREK